VRLHGWRNLDPAVLAKLRKVAAIRENPYASLHAQYALLHNQYTLLSAQQGELVVPIFPPTTAADRFDLEIETAVYVTHCTIALGSAKKLTARKQIARCAQELANTLRALRRDEKDLLVHFLPPRRQATFDDFITVTRELADKARLICSLAGRPSSQLRREAQRFLVNHLLDAAADADGSLKLNSRSERGTLVDAVELLLPYLPQEFSKMPSFSTLKSLRRAWVKNREKKIKTPPI
jgi:hypothetical protein